MNYFYQNFIPDNLGNNCWNDANMRATGVQTEYRNENFHS